MKKFFIAFALLASLLTGCSETYKSDPYSSYRKYTAADLFHKAQISIRKERFSDAVDQLEAMDAMYPFGPYAERSQLDIIYAYYKNSDASSAIVAADRYTHLYPRGKHVDYALYMRGLASFEVGTSWLQRKLKVNLAVRDTDTLRQAYVAFSTLRRQFPKSAYTASAHHYLIMIRNMMAERYLYVAKHYCRLGAYMACANRAAALVQHYEGTLFVPDALGMMVTSYRKLGLTDLADRSLRVLATTYPASSAYQSLK